MLRREFLERALAFFGSMACAPVDVERLVFAADGAGSVDRRLLDDLDTLTRSYGQLRDGVASAVLLPYAVRHLDVLMDVLTRSQATPEILRAQRMTAQTAIIVGWLSFNLHQFGGSQHHWILAGALAREAGDADLEAYAVGCQSRLRSRIHRGGQGTDPRIAVAMLGHASSVAAHSADPALQSWLLVNRAEQFADLNDVPSCYGDIDAAARALHTVGPRDDILWSQWAIPRLDGYRGNCERLMQHPARAIEIMEDSIGRLDGRFVGRVLQLSDLAAAHAEEREVAHACDLLVEAATIARDAGFVEGLRRAQYVRRTVLAEWDGDPAMAPFDTQFPSLQ